MVVLHKKPVLVSRALALDVAAQALVVVPRLPTAAPLTTHIGMLETAAP